ncbi:MAG: O-antigen ligase family protein [Planctomycetes bacterium]|nr:O-antigen ligase family protein [Planctomycetota bacterium]
MPEPIADARSPGGGRIGGVFTAAAMAILILAVASRCFLGELGFRTSPLRSSYALLQMGDAGRKDAPQMLPKELGEFSRVSIAILLMGAFCLGELGRLLEKRRSLFRRGLAGWLAVAFIAISAASAWLADDLRSAWDSWLEQASLVMMFLLAAGLCEDKRRFAMAAVVLAGLGAALAAKGLIQIGIEVPARIAAFEADPAGTLAQLGYRPGTPEARLLESRIRDRTAIGFLPLANLFASMLMIVLAAAAGLAADKLSVGRQQAVEFRMPKGRLSPMSAYGVLAVVIAIIVLAVLLMTRSRAGLVFAGAVAAIAVLAGIFRGFFTRHRWKIVAAGLAVLLAGSGWLVWYGIKNDRLPAKSLTFRWFYWTASAEIVRESGTATILGVGPGNFPAAYLRHRRAEAEESIKMPHNTVAHAAAEYGLVGGTLFVGLLVLALLGAARRGRVARASCPCVAWASRPCPPKSGQEKIVPAEGWSGWEKFLLVLVAPCAAAARVLLVGWGDSAFLDVILPGAALAVGLWLFGGWALQAVAEGPGFTRMAIGFGALALALHSLMEPNLWTPAPATLFWLAAGACLGQAESKKRTACKQAVAPDTETHDTQPDSVADEFGSDQTEIGFMRLVFCILVISITGASIYYIWQPVAKKSSLDCKVQSAALAGDADAAIEYALQAARADNLDDQSILDATRMMLLKADRKNMAVSDSCFNSALSLMKEREDYFRNDRKYDNLKERLRDEFNNLFRYEKYREYLYVQTLNGLLKQERAWYYCRANLRVFIEAPDYFKYPWDARAIPDEKSVKNLERAVNENPTDPQLKWTLGQMEYVRGNYSSAYFLLKKVSELDPQSVIVKYRLGDAAWNAGMKEQAHQAWIPPSVLMIGNMIKDLSNTYFCDRMDARLGLEFCRYFLDIGLLKEEVCVIVLNAIKEIRNIENKIKAFNPESVELFSPVEWRELETLEARAKFLLEYVKSQSASQSAPATQPAPNTQTNVSTQPQP